MIGTSIATLYLLAAVDWVTLGQYCGLFLVGLVTGFLPKFLDWFKEKKAHAFDVSATVSDDLRIQDMLTELRVQAEADRAVIYLFHNGGTFLDGSPIKKMSMTYESVKLGVSYVSDDSKDILISRVPHLIDTITNEDGPKLIIEPDLPDGYLKHSLASKCVLGASYCRLMDGPQIIGFVGVNYCVDSEEKLPKDMPQKLHVLGQQAATLEVVLLRRLGQYKKRKDL